MKKVHLILLLFTTSILGFSQTQLNQGDVLTIAVNANNGSCSGNNAEDVVYLVAFKDITNGTQIDFTDNGWEREYNGFFGTDGEGTYRFTRTGGTLTAGTVFSFTFPNDNFTVATFNPDWNYTLLDATTNGRALNLSSSGDQLFVMQGGNWTETATLNQGSYSGTLLFAFNSITFWNADGSRGDSNLPPSLNCFNTTTNLANTDFLRYSGPMLPAVTQAEWFERFNTAGNWTRDTSCANFNNNFTINTLDFVETFTGQPIATQQICLNESLSDLVLSANGSTLTYQWYVSTTNDYNSGTIIPSATQNTYTPPNNTAGTFYYFCEVSFSGACPIKSEISQVIITANTTTSAISAN